MQRAAEAGIITIHKCTRVFILICYNHNISAALLSNLLQVSRINIYSGPHFKPFHHHHYLVVPSARISLTLSRHLSLSFITFGRSSGLHHIPTELLYVGLSWSPCFLLGHVKWDHRSTSLMSLSLLLQQCPASLVHLTWIFFVMGSRCPYKCCFLGCCLQDLFNIARSILV